MINSVDEIKEAQESDHDADGGAVHCTDQDLGEVDEGANKSLKAGACRQI